MSNEEILNELLKSTRETQKSMNEIQNSMKILQEDVKDLNDKYTQLDKKVTKLDDKVTELDEKTTRIDRSVMVIEQEYTKKIDVIYENTTSFINANFKNRDAIEKLEKRVERLECMMPIKPMNQKEA